MVFKHDFKNFPELSNSQINEGIRSPHKQITEDFEAFVFKVHDGDTVTLKTDFRRFNFPIRFLNIDAPELNAGGEKAREWLKKRIERKTVQIKINKDNRVDKYGRLLGEVVHLGLNVGEEMLRRRLVKAYDQRGEGKIPNIKKLIARKQWLTAD